MPYLGLSSFLLHSRKMERWSLKCFNALPRAFFFSTFLKPFQSYQFQRFQCPTSGFLLFYRHNRKAKWNSNGNVSMPYLGLSSFLQGLGRLVGRKKRIVSMPYLGLSSFLPTINIIKQSYAPMRVSMPYLGLSSFLRYVSASLEFTGFANPFLRVIIWQFDFKPFFSCYFPYSYFSHILFYFVRFPWHIYLNMIPAILQ